MAKRLYFYPDACETTQQGLSLEAVAAELNALELEYDQVTHEVSLVAPPSGTELYSIHVRVVYESNGYHSTTSSVLTVLKFDNSCQSSILSDENAARVIGFEVELNYPTNSSQEDRTGRAYLKAEVSGEFIYPSGEISFKDLPATTIGFKDIKNVEFSHVRFFVSEILHDGTVGGEGHVWESPVFDKNLNCLATLENIMQLCEGKELTQFNVTYYLLAENAEGGYEVVDTYIVGDATNVATFAVRDAVLNVINLTTTAYCLDPVLLTINRSETPEIQNVTVEIQGYKADFEFYANRNILEIDIAQYLQVLFANVDIFEHQQLTATIFVKLFNAEWEHLETQGITITAIYGKKLDPALPRCKVRVQWLDKYAVLHDEYFKIVENLTEGGSKQIYISDREEREDKTGEKSITLAKILANNTEREALKTIVFSDHVRAYIGDGWKRVKVANTYKTGAGREKKNFEITIKYAL